MATQATLTIASRNYGSWSLRGWLLCKLAGLDFSEERVASDDPFTRAELLLLLLHAGFSNLRSALPMNLKAHHPGFKVWAGAQADIDRIVSIWRECLAAYQGPFLFVAEPCMADAMFALVVTRFLTYDVTLDSDCATYAQAIMDLAVMQEWLEAANAEPDEVVELDVEF